MRVILLSPYPERLAPVFERAGDSWRGTTGPLGDEEADWLISFGYRHIIREPHLSKFAGRLINVHIGLLPWNRGADPNFWSWHDGTPKGVTIHDIDAGIDTGGIVAQQEIVFQGHYSETLRTTHDKLISLAIGLFGATWPQLRRGRNAIDPFPKRDGGTLHRSRDREAIWHHFPLGWDTPVTDVEDFGAETVHGKTSVTVSAAVDTPPN